MSIDRVNLVGNKIYVLILINIKTHPYIHVQRDNIFPYYIRTRGVLFCVEDFSHATDDRYQTRGRHNATCTTLPHSSSSGTHHAHARGESSLC